MEELTYLPGGETSRKTYDKEQYTYSIQYSRPVVRKHCVPFRKAHLDLFRLGPS